MKPCFRCGVPKPLEAFRRDASKRDGYRPTCKDCECTGERQRYAANPAIPRERQRQYRADHLEQERDRDRRRHGGRRDENAERKRRQRAALKALVFGHYGRQCACCGSTERLSIDHVNGDGAEHRREIFGVNRMPSESMYRWIIANDYPDDLQTLCKPCNQSKYTYKSCRLDHAQQDAGTG